MLLSRYVVIKHTYEGTEACLKGRKAGLFVNFGQFPWSWIRIRIDPDPDPRQQIECGSRWIRIRIHNTVKNTLILLCGSGSGIIVLTLSRIRDEKIGSGIRY